MRSIRQISYVLVVICLAKGAFAQSRVVSTLAGTGVAGLSGDGGPATAAKLNGPNDVTVDSNGDVYIADRNNNRIRKVDISTGVIRTVAGSGVAGWFLSGGPALSARLDHPSGVAVDRAGNLYIADDLLENEISRIHKLTVSTGMISKVEIPVLLTGAVAIALDSNGSLYIAEQAAHRIRKFDFAGGSLTTIAGTGAPGFSGDGGEATSAHINTPAHLAIDSNDNLYFSDSLNHRIRKVEAGSGIITTVVGSGPAGGAGGLSGDGGPATAAQLNSPRGVAVDRFGNIFVADTLNRRIRRVSARTGMIATIVSASEECFAASSSLTSPDSLAVNASGTMLYIADDAGNRVWQVTLDPDSLPPSLTSVEPSQGIVGTTIQVVLGGSGFLGAMAALQNPGCSVNGTTVFVSGNGITVDGVNVTSNTSLSATLTIAAGAPTGPREVTVTTDSGTSGSVQFTVASSPPTLSSITPANGARESSVTVTLTGTNFAAQSGSTGVSVDGTGISISEVNVASANSLTAIFTISRDAALGNRNVTVVTAGGVSNAASFMITPQSPAFTYALPQILNPTEQAPIQLGLANALPDTVTATLQLTFSPNASNPMDDPNVLFINSQTSTRTVSVTFPANAAIAEFSLPSGVLQAGTVAGMIELSVIGVQVGGVEAISTGSDFDVQVPRLVPIITDVRILNRTSAGFDVEVTGYSTSRDITSATFSFGGASGAHLVTVELEPDVRSSFDTYYQSETSSPAGGSFVYVQPFIVQQGDVNAVASVTVTLTNTQGTSEPRTVQ